MNDVLQDGPLLIKLCKEMNHDAVVNSVLNNNEVKNYINKIASNKDASTQLMHDTILSLIRSCMKVDFEFKSDPISYVKAIAKYINYTYFKQEKKISQLNVQNSVMEYNTYVIDFDLKDLLQGFLGLLSDDCKDILLLWSMKYKMSEIAQRLEYNSIGYTRKKKHFCLKSLVSKVDNHPKLKEELRMYV